MVVAAIALRWIGVAKLPRLAHNVGLAAVYRSLREAYAGGVVYTFRRPDPLPRVFGYNDLFHPLTIVAVASQYVAVGVFVVAVG